jgi:hypothetical protein
MLIAVSVVSAQSGKIVGTVKDNFSNTPIEFANILIIETGEGTITDSLGTFSISDLNPGFYSLQISFIGYQSILESEIEVLSSVPTFLEFKLVESSSELEQVVVKANAFERSTESPNSLRSIGLTEIKRNPGGNRDISLVIRSFPGVTSTASFRNDLIIRGGAPNENRFYLDEVEIPTINHFSTQGSSGGPASILNVDFIREVDFYSGAFPANRDNSLSSVFNFKQKEGRKDRFGYTATIGASVLGVTAEGPLGDKTTLLASARRSYLQFLFSALELPFLPTYNDFNLKIKTRINPKNELSFIGVGAIDQFRLNTDANDTELQQYLLQNLPVNEQWTYTTGLVYKNYDKKGFTTIVLSRSENEFSAYKYSDNDQSDPDNLIFDYQSHETENHFRLERSRVMGQWKTIYGGRFDVVNYSNSTQNKIFTRAGQEDISYQSELTFLKYGAFGQLSRSYIEGKLELSAGLNIGGNDFSAEMSNPLEQVSPRLSVSYNLTPQLSANLNAGIYYQLPPYTSMGYRESDVLVNKANGLKPIRADHLVLGLSYLTKIESKLSLEAYYKDYAHYPFLLRDSISLANLGGDFGVIGNEPLQSVSDGLAYGLELFYQQKLYKGFYGLMAYTLGWSEFSNGDNNLIASSWDARHIINLTLGKQFGKRWEVGVKWRYQDGLPNTPFSADSDLVVSWDRNKASIPDYSRINTLRDEALSEIDIRIDKRWYFEKWSIDLYLDVRNILGNAIASRTMLLDIELDEDDKPIGDPVIINPNAPISEQRYLTKVLSEDDGTPLPTIGVVIKI